MQPTPVFRRLPAFATAAAAALLAAAFTQGAVAQTVLRYSNWLPAGYPVRVQIVEPWLADIEKATEGRVKVESTPKVVGTVAGQFDVVRDGLADLALIVPGFTPGRFELIEVMEMPFLGDVSSARSPATWRIYKKELERFDEFKGVVVLSLFTGNAAHVFTTAKKEFKTVDDFKGVKLRSPSPAAAQTITLLGGVPVLKPVSEIYELASSGVIDGGVLPPEVVTGFKVDGILKRFTVIPGGFINTVNVIAINPDKWKTIARADQDAILRISGEALARRWGSAHDVFGKEAADQLVKGGTAIDRPNAAMVEQMKLKVKSVETDWFEKARKKGLADPARVLDDLRKDIASGGR